MVEAKYGRRFSNLIRSVCQAPVLAITVHVLTKSPSVASSGSRPAHCIARDSPDHSYTQRYFAMSS